VKQIVLIVFVFVVFMDSFVSCQTAMKYFRKCVKLVEIVMYVHHLNPESHKIVKTSVPTSWKILHLHYTEQLIFAA
jgi:hypothetical protein